MICALPGDVFLCGGSNYSTVEDSDSSDSPYAWVLPYLEGWGMKEQCTLGVLGVPVNIQSYNESVHWTTDLKIVFQNKIDSALDHNSTADKPRLGWVFLLACLLNHGIPQLEKFICNLSATLAETADDTEDRMAAQQRSLESLVKVVLDYRIALDFLLAQQGGVCAIANTSCYA